MAERQKQPQMARRKPVYSITKYNDILGNNNELIDGKGAEDANSVVLKQ